MVRRLKFLKAFELLYAPAVILPKFAILSLYMKIFATHSKKTRWICYAMGTAMICILIYGLITPLVSCRPFAYNWDRTIPGGSCINIMASYRWTSFPNIITDLILMGICLPAICKCHGLKNSRGIYLLCTSTSCRPHSTAVDDEIKSFDDLRDWKHVNDAPSSILLSDKADDISQRNCHLYPPFRPILPHRPIRRRVLQRSTNFDLDHR